MSTKIERFEMIIEALTNNPSVSTATKFIIADRFVDYHRQAVIAAGLDPDNLTNTQKATVVVTCFRNFGLSVVRSTAENGERLNVAAQIKAVGDTAEIDLAEV